MAVPVAGWPVVGHAGWIGNPLGDGRCGSQVRVLITVEDAGSGGLRLLPWLEGGPAAKHAVLEPVGRPGHMGAADILAVVADTAGLGALVFQIGAWWTMRSRQPTTPPPEIVIEYGEVRVRVENADSDHLNQIIAALTDDADGGSEGGATADEPS